MVDQGVIISLLSNPSPGEGAYFSGSISGVKIVFNNGLNNADFQFTDSDAEILANPLHRVKIGINAEQSAVNLKAFLDNNGYVSNSVSIYYALESGGGSFAVKGYFGANENIYFEISTNIDFNPGDPLPSISIVAFYGNNPPVITPKYFFEYTNSGNEKWRCEIFQNNFGGQSVEIFGRATIVKSEAKSHLDLIRGTGLELQLEANQEITFEDFYSIDERNFTVRLYRQNILEFQGFLKPDGIYQSFVGSIWIINIQCVDGLGFLSDLSFVKPNGVPYSGRISMFDIIANCLNRTGLQLKINTFINVFYYGLATTPDTDVLRNACLNTDRFKKSDDNTLMSCQEVLTSVLDLFNACITQYAGEWHIYRPNDFQNNTYPIFKTYEIDNTYIGLNQLNLNRKLGSQIDNYYPHHCNSNQRIELKGAISAFRLGYKYGFLGSLLGNGSLYHLAGTKIYDNWDVQTWDESVLTGSLVIDPVSTNGISFKAATTLGAPRQFRKALISNVSITLQEGYTFDFKTRFISYGFPASVRFTVRVGGYYLNYIDGSWDDSSALHFDLTNAAVDEFPNSTGAQVDQKFDRSFTINSQPVPADGLVEITMYVPQKSIGGSFIPLVEVKSVELVNTFQGNNIVGEFHTVARVNPVSSLVKDNKAVSNGDSVNDVYLGAIYKQDKVSLTDNWYRAAFPGSEVKPLLRIVAEDQLRISQIPTKVFSGDVYGYCSYLAVYSINNLSGKFMPISWSFDTFLNITTMRNLELYSPELFDIDYTKTDDYGETVKPTIVG